MKPSQLTAALPKLIASRIPVMIWGNPGIGKSEISRAVTEDLGIGFVDMRLTLYDPTALLGFPYLGSEAKKSMRFAPPHILPTEGEGVILLDELPQASPATQAAAYQLILDRRINEYELPKGWHIIAAGNHASNGGLHHAMAPALSNRFTHIDLVANQTDWDIWAKDKVSDLIRAFLRFRPGLVDDFDNRQGSRAWSNARALVKADKIIKDKHDAGTELELLTGTLGEGAATELLAFFKTATELPSLNEILVSPDTAPVPQSPAAKYAVATLLESKVSKDNFDRCMTYIHRLDKEYQTAFMHNITRHKRELTDTQTYINWCLNNKELLGVG